MPGPDRRMEAPALLSFAQQRLWFLDRLRPGRPDQNVPAAVRLRGRLDEAALVSALTEVVRRHEVLRSRIVVVEDSPYQVTEPVGTFVPTVTDLTGLPPAQALERGRELVAADMATPFDLGVAPMLRARLIRLTADDHLLLLVIHHIAADGWSLSVLWQEFSAVYRAAVTGRAATLAELPVQYADFAAWQHGSGTGAAPRDQLAYWREQLSGPSRPAFPADRPRPALWSGRGDEIGIEIPPGTADRIRALGHAQGMTPFMTLLAAFQVLIARSSGEPEVSVGTPISGRTRIEVEPLIGFFVNTLVLRTDLSGDPTFTEVLGRVRQVAVDAYAHQDVPFERLVEEVRPARDPGQHPLFTVMFQLDEPPALPAGLPGVGASALPVPYPLVKFDIEVSLTDRGDHFTGVLRYATDLFSHGTAHRLVQDFRSLLDHLAGSPGRPISEWEPPLGPRVGRAGPGPSTGTGTPSTETGAPSAEAATPSTGTGTSYTGTSYTGTACTGAGRPSTETELLVTEVWTEVLGAAPAGVHSDFFASGGHSLPASRLMSRLGRALGLELPVALLFHHPTVAELADRIDAALLGELTGAPSAAVPAAAGEGRRS
ncbi:condensation domain-containing protein [Streptomyces sp. NPDC000594]|uniref:condensation domain-containing protein n=1 Tax=Streptomyces sp. NPDC000594 TaxID=3154261 RepID=UPI00333379C8